MNLYETIYSDEAIQKTIAYGSVYFLQDGDKIVGTGSIDGNEINRLFVLPQYQGYGYGTAIMNELEKIIFCNHSEIVVDASLTAYEIPIKYHKIKTENGHYLCYHSIKKYNYTL